MLAAVTVIFLKKTKNQFLDKINGSMSTKFQVCIVFRLARRRDTNKYMHKYTTIQVKLGISSTGSSPHVDFNYTIKVFSLEKCLIYESLNYIRKVKKIWCKAQSVYCKKCRLGPENYIVKLKLY